MNKKGFTLVEIMIVASILGALAAGAALVNFVRTRQAAQEALCAHSRRMIEQAEAQYFVGQGRHSVNFQDLVDQGYLRKVPACPAGGVYAWVPAPSAGADPQAQIGCSVHGTVEASPGLVGMWSMEEGSGSVIGSPPTQGQIFNASWTGGKVGSALLFGGVTNGLDDYVQIPDHESLHLADQGTLQAWIYPDAAMSYGGIIHKGTMKDFSDEAYSLQYYGGKLALGVVGDDGTYWRFQTNVNPAKSSWTHVAATWGDDGMKVYVGGQAVAGTLYQSPDGNKWTRAPDQAQAVVARATDGDVQIGAQLDQQYNSSMRNLGFSGKIDEVQISKFSLSAEEIRDYYESTR